MRAASRSLALSSVFARGMAISVGDAFPKGVNVQARAQPPMPTPASMSRPACLQPHRRHPRRRQVNFKENLPIESLTSKGNVLMVSLPGAFTPT